MSRTDDARRAAFAVHDAVYYCVANMPGAVPATSTRALTNATLPYLLKLADLGWRDALATDSAPAKVRISPRDRS